MGPGPKENIKDRIGSTLYCGAFCYFNLTYTEMNPSPNMFYNYCTVVYP